MSLDLGRYSAISRSFGSLFISSRLTDIARAPSAHSVCIGFRSRARTSTAHALIMTLAEALQKSLLFFRAQRSGDLGADNPVPFRSLPSFVTDGSAHGVDLSKGYFDAGDFVKYGQPAAYTISMLAWSGLEFADGFRAAGSLSELHNAVRWGTDYILEASRHLDAQCTFYAQVGRGAAEGCDGAPGCSYDHGYWGRPEDYSAYPFAAARQTSVISAAAPGTECAPCPLPYASLILHAPLAHTHLPTTLLHLLALRRNRAHLPPRSCLPRAGSGRRPAQRSLPHRFCWPTTAAASAASAVRTRRLCCSAPCSSMDAR